MLWNCLTIVGVGLLIISLRGQAPNPRKVAPEWLHGLVAALLPRILDNGTRPTSLRPRDRVRSRGNMGWLRA